jgi:hypothetical protein
MVSTAERTALAAIVVLVDLLLFALPLTGLLAAYLIIARPPWFRQWIDRLYAPGPGGSAE